GTVAVLGCGHGHRVARQHDGPVRQRRMCADGFDEREVAPGGDVDGADGSVRQVDRAGAADPQCANVFPLRGGGQAVHHLVHGVEKWVRGFLRRGGVAHVVDESASRSDERSRDLGPTYVKGSYQDIVRGRGGVSMTTHGDDPPKGDACSRGKTTSHRSTLMTTMSRAVRASFGWGARSGFRLVNIE